VLDLYYRAPAPFYVFYVFWYLFLGLAAVTMIAGAVTGGVSVEGLGFLLLVIILLIVIPVGMHHFGTRNSDEELRELLDFLAVEADATLQHGLQAPQPSAALTASLEHSQRLDRQ
jgi:hypothetical protein